MKVVTIVIYRRTSSTYVVDSVVCRLVVYFKNGRDGHKPSIGQYNSVVIETIENDSKQSRAEFCRIRYNRKHGRRVLFKNDRARRTVTRRKFVSFRGSTRSRCGLPPGTTSWHRIRHEIRVHLVHAREVVGSWHFRVIFPIHFGLRWQKRRAQPVSATDLMNSRTSPFAGRFRSNDAVITSRVWKRRRTGARKQKKKNVCRNNRACDDARRNLGEQGIRKKPIVRRRKGDANSKRNSFCYYVTKES